ncbi:hypothetical protein D3C76_1590600 [compost metagenome]
MVGGDHDQGVFQLGVGLLHLVQGGLDGVVEGQGILQGALGVGVVQGVIDAAPLHHQEVALLLVLELLDGGQGHLGQRRLAGGPVEVIFHVA